MIRGARSLLAIAVVAAAVYTAADVVARKVAEDHMSGAVRAQFSLDTDPKVSISGFPFIVRALVKHRIPGVTIDARAVTIDELLLRSAHVELHGLHADNFLATERLTLTVERGTASAEADREALQKFLTSRKIAVTIGLREGVASASAKRRIGGKDHTFSATGSLAIRGGRFAFVPKSLRLDGRAVPSSLVDLARRVVTFSVAIPELPGGLRPERVEVHDGFVRLVASAKNAAVRFGS
jgi:hypothetical protein